MGSVVRSLAVKADVFKSPDIICIRASAIMIW